jgi:hypothetical protein
MEKLHSKGKVYKHTHIRTCLVDEPRPRNRCVPKERKRVEHVSCIGKKVDLIV